MKDKRLKSNSYLTEDQKLMCDLGPDLYKYFSDSRLGKKDKVKKKTTVTSGFKVGDQVEVPNHGYGMIILGPYDGIHGDNTYEIELESGVIVTKPDDGRSILIYIPPIEKPNDDDGF